LEETLDQFFELRARLAVTASRRQALSQRLVSGSPLGGECRLLARVLRADLVPSWRVCARRPSEPEI